MRRRFDALEIGTQFMVPGETVVYVKTTATLATRVEDDAVFGVVAWLAVLPEDETVKALMGEEKSK